MGANTSQEIENNQNSAKNKLRYPQVASNGRPSIQKPISKKSKQKVLANFLIGLMRILYIAS